MNCQEFEDRLQRRLDGELAGDAASAEHVLSCSSCRLLQAAASRLEQGLRLLKCEEAPQGLSGRVVTQLVVERRQDVRRRRVAFVGALAASLLVALLAKYLWQPAAPNPQPKAPEVARAEPVVAPLQESAGEAQSALAALLSRTAEETVSQGRLLLPEVPAPMMAVDDWHPTFEPPALPLREAGQGVSAGLEPVASSARRAFNLFLREIPPMPVEEKP